MKKKQFKSILQSLLLVTLIVLVSCSKEEDEPPVRYIDAGINSAYFNPDITYGTMTDQDGIEYKTVQIGTQVWMAENLKTTLYNDGTPIPRVHDNEQWENLTTGAYCNLNDTPDSNIIVTYGRLYNWYAVNTGKLAPVGWHVPTYQDWKELIDYVGDDYDGGNKLKEKGDGHWIGGNWYATNETGFTALPGGYRAYDGTFYEDRASWWTSFEEDSINGYSFGMGYSSGNVGDGKSLKNYGKSIRLIKD